MCIRDRSPEPALRLLLTEDEEEAAALAQQLDEANTRRKQLEQQGMADVARLLRDCLLYTSRCV